MKFNKFAGALFLSILTNFSIAQAALSPSVPQEFKFHFNFRGETYYYSQKGSSYEKAFEKAAQACFNHYKSGQKLTENQGLDIIDVCANPRS